MRMLVGIAFASVICGVQAQTNNAIFEGKPESYWIDTLTNKNAYGFQYDYRTKWIPLGTNAVRLAIDGIEKWGGMKAVSRNASIIFANINDPTVITQLVTTTSDPHVKAALLSQLTSRGDLNITTLATSALTDANPEVRAAAIWALGFGRSQLIPGEAQALAHCLLDDDPDVRSLAASYLCAYQNGPQTPGITMHHVAEAALAEMKAGSTNADPNIREAANKALKEIIPEMALITYRHEIAISQAELDGKPWSAFLKVVDEDGKPVSNAAASVGYAVPDVTIDGRIEMGWRDLEGMTDDGGVFLASHKGPAPVGFRAELAGYYSSSGSREIVGLDEDDPALWKPTFLLVLKRKIRPIPMFVNRVDIAHREKPATDRAIGFDLELGDFVAPYGKGTNSQLYFTWHTDYDTNDISATFGSRTRYGWNGTMTISFPNPGDGIQVFDVPGTFTNRLSEGSLGSELRSPQLAPLGGYQSQLIETSRWHYYRLPDVYTYDHVHKNYIFRVKTVVDSNGNIRSAQYGKIYGDFDEAMTTYLNAETNSRSIEYDMRHNLGKGGNNFYITY